MHPASLTQTSPVASPALWPPRSSEGSIPAPAVSWDCAASFEAQLEASLDAVAERESGPLGEALRYQLAAPGPRPLATMAHRAAAALDLPVRATDAIGLACELLREARLVHDDLQDRDTQRGGRETLWAHFGEEVALGVGDFLLAAAFDAISDAPLPADRGVALVKCFAACAQSVFRAQVMETDDAMRALDSFEDHAHSHAGALLALPVELALIAAAAPTSERAEVRRVCEPLGRLSAVHNDLHDLFGDEGRIAGGDLRNRRPNVVGILHRALVDEGIDYAFDAAPPGDRDALVGGVRTAVSVDAAIAYADHSRAETEARLIALRPALRDVIRKVVQELASSIDRIRSVRVCERGESAPILDSGAILAEALPLQRDRLSA